jgi:hypothetical protein
VGDAVRISLFIFGAGVCSRLLDQLTDILPYDGNTPNRPIGNSQSAHWKRPPRSRKALEASGYLLHVVVNGQRAMPPFGVMMNDEQIAAVVNYVRTHFGNAYKDAVIPEDVKVVRP